MSKVSSRVQVWEREPFAADIHSDRGGYAVRRSAKNHLGFVDGAELTASKECA